MSDDDWKQQLADHADRAIQHPLVTDVVDELMRNLGTGSPLVEYGIRKVAHYAATVARAQALGIDPDDLRLAPGEAHRAMQRQARAAVSAGLPTTLIDDSGITRLD